MGLDFGKLVGQERVKKTLSFHYEGFKKNQLCAWLLFLGGKGAGKTQFARTFASKLRNKDGLPRKYLEINCSAIKNKDHFFSDYFNIFIQDQEVTVLFDEFHNLPKDLAQLFLTVFNNLGDGETKRSVEYGGGTAFFDYAKQTYLFATTEAHDLFEPLKDRLYAIDFAPYSVDELGRIINNISHCSFEKEALDKVALTTRGNARDAVKKIKLLKTYCEIDSILRFENRHFEDWCDQTGTLPFGLNQAELSILRELEFGDLSLQALAARTNIQKGAIQKHYEVFLQSRKYMEIVGKRKITRQGLEVLKEVNRYDQNV